MSCFFLLNQLILFLYFYVFYSLSFLTNVMWVNLVSLAVLAAATSATTSASLSNHATILADNSANLAFSLYQTMAKEKNVENILISPVVVASSLGLVALGGKASTASQVKTILNAGNVKDELLHSGLAELLAEVSDPKTRNVTWTIGNHLYGPSSVTFVDDFVKSSKKHYNCDHTKINFRDQKSVVNSINKWAAKSTDGKLPAAIKDVEQTDGAMIISAMFFKRKYRNPCVVVFCDKVLDNIQMNFSLLFFSSTLG